MTDKNFQEILRSQIKATVAKRCPMGISDDVIDDIIADLRLVGIWAYLQNEVSEHTSVCGHRTTDECNKFQWCDDCTRDYFLEGLHVPGIDA